MLHRLIKFSICALVIFEIARRVRRARISDHDNTKLDAELAETFPASDPVAHY